MKIKAAPHDFVVREIVDMNIGRGRKYRIYLLEKEGWNTLDAIRSVADASGADARTIGYAGLKDRHARTSQHISVPAGSELRSKREDIRLTFLGFCDDFVSTRVLVGNRFNIRVGGLSERAAEGVAISAAAVRERGFPNYFDDQRFGSLGQEGEFVAERLAKGHLKGALKIHLSTVFPSHKKAERERRAKVAEAWGKWDRVLSLCESEEDKAVAAPLAGGAGKKNLLAALNAVEPEVAARYVAAYQAFVWNETLRRLMRESGGPLVELPGKAGPYVFRAPARNGVNSVDSGNDLTATEIPTVAARILDCDPKIASITRQVLAERGLLLSDLNIRGFRAGYFKSFPRRAAVVPFEFGVASPTPDRDDPRKTEIALSFALRAGSYATMLLKALLLRPAASPRLKHSLDNIVDGRFRQGHVPDLS